MKALVLVIAGLAAALVPLAADGDAVLGSVSAEIGRLRGAVEKAATGSAERHDALVSLGRLLRLSGDLEGAAQAWAQAAGAQSGQPDNAALLESALCSMAMGEWEKAEAAARLVLLASKDAAISSQARALLRQIAAFRADSSEVKDLLAASPAAKAEPALYYTLWKSSGETVWKTRLLETYPQSPEALVAGGDGAVSAQDNVHWLLLGGREGVVLSPLSGEGFSPAAPAASEREIGTAEAPLLQTGLFSHEENARAQAERLQTQGFPAGLRERTVSGTIYWAVCLPAGDNPRETTLKLKEAGFESFPVF